MKHVIFGISVLLAGLMCSWMAAGWTAKADEPRSDRPEDVKLP